MKKHQEKQPSLPCPAKHLLYHKPPMILIDQLIEREKEYAKAKALAGADNLFFSSDSGPLPEYFIEIMAQTMAAAQGYDAFEKNIAPKSGLIVGIENFTLHNIPANIRTFTIKVNELMAAGSMKIMTGQVEGGGNIIAEAELKVWQ